MRQTNRETVTGHWLVIVVYTLLIAGCVGTVGKGWSNGHDGSDSPHGGDSGGNQAGTFGGEGGTTLPVEQISRIVNQCDETQKRARGSSFDRMRRLSRDELTRTLRALLGDAIVSTPTIRDRLAGLPSDELVAANNFVETPPVGLASTLDGIAKTATTQAMANSVWKSNTLGACTNQTTLTDACVSQAIKTFATRVWRRPIGDTETTKYMGFYRATGGGHEGLSFLLRRLLQSPSLVFHIESGSGEPTENGRVRLTAFEVASRISYLVAGTMPDDVLMRAAGNGDLDQPDGVVSQIKRLLSGDDGRNKVTDFLRYYANLRTVPDPLVAAAKLIGVNQTTGLGQQMHQETQDFMQHVLWTTDGTFLDLMTSSAAFPRTESLARILGTSAVVDGEVGRSPSHPGLLHRPALLASVGGRTSPIIRGAHVRKEFLCTSLGLPDPQAVEDQKNAVEGKVGDTDKMSSRERATALTDAGPCRSCHVLINGLGFAFEGYDVLGALRTEETVLDENGITLGTWPVDTAVTNPEIEDGGPETLSGSLELTAALGQGFSATACLSQRLLEYYRARIVDEQSDGCTLRETEIRAHTDSLQETVVAALANEDIFWRSLP